MTVWAVVVVFVATLEPFGRRGLLSVSRPRDVWAGAAAATGAYLVLAVLGTTVRDALDVSAPNARIAAGLVLLASGLHAALRRPPVPAVTPPSRTDWLVPVCFPVLLRPDLALVALAADDAGATVAVGAAALVATAACAAWWARAPRAPGGRIVHALGATCGVAAVLAAVRIALDGVFAL